MTKDFSKINTGRVGADIESATGKARQQSAALADEKAARQEAMRTQGRKGCKNVRINMAVTPSNYDYIKAMSRAAGMSMTEYANYVIKQYRLEHPEIYKQVKGFAAQLEEMELRDGLGLEEDA